jgi:hypothetical protein
LLVLPKYVRKAQFVTYILLIPILAHRIGIVYMVATPSPYCRLSHIAIADLHTLVIETRTFRKPLNDETRLSLQSLHTEKEPGRPACRIGLPFKLDLVCTGCCELDCRDVTAFEIALKNSVTDRYDLAQTTLDPTHIFIGFPDVEGRGELIIWM